MKLTFITLSCGNTINNNLMLSPDIFTKYKLYTIRESYHVTKSLQGVIEWLRPNFDVLVILHDDVRLLEGFEENLMRSIELLNEMDKNWSLAGVAGAIDKGVVAHIADRDTVLGSYIETPIKVDTLDEVLIVVNTKHKLKLDEGIRTHHLWATDLCLQSKEKGLNCYVIEALVHHNSNNNYVLGKDYYDQVGYIKSKWSHMLPFNTTCYTFRGDN